MHLELTIYGYLRNLRKMSGPQIKERPPRPCGSGRHGRGPVHAAWPVSRRNRIRKGGYPRCCEISDSVCCGRFVFVGATGSVFRVMISSK